MTKWIPPKSPYNLIQEQLWEDPWKIFVACIFCNLTRRVDAEPFIWDFLREYPTPQAASRACVKTLQKSIQPLGLSERRSRALVLMSDGYLRKSWRDNPTVLYGIGKYASDAYRIFCLGDIAGVTPRDHALNDYHTWIKNERP